MQATTRRRSRTRTSSSACWTRPSSKAAPSAPSIGIPIDQALESRDVFQKVGLFEDWANTLLYKDEYRKTFSVYENTITGLYEASKPEILGRPVVRTVAVFQYLRGVIDSIIQQQDVDSAVRRIGDLLDESLVVDDTGLRAGQGVRHSLQ